MAGEKQMAKTAGATAGAAAGAAIGIPPQVGGKVGEKLGSLAAKGLGVGKARAKKRGTGMPIMRHSYYDKISDAKQRKNLRKEANPIPDELIDALGLKAVPDVPVQIADRMSQLEEADLAQTLKKQGVDAVRAKYYGETPKTEKEPGSPPPEKPVGQEIKEQKFPLPIIIGAAALILVLLLFR